MTILDLTVRGGLFQSDQAPEKALLFEYGYPWLKQRGDNSKSRDSLFQREASEKAILFLMCLYPWPRQTKVIIPQVGTACVRVFVQVRYNDYAP